MQDFATALYETQSPAYFICTEPEVLDFTSMKQAEVHVYTPKMKMSYTFSVKELPLLVSLLKVAIFDKNNLAVFWDAKQFASCVRYFLKKELPFKCMDLKVLEAFANIHKKRPENLMDAINRLKALSKNNLYKVLHEPLIFDVVPNIETTGLLNIETRCPQFPYYEIEGQQNGRFNSTKKFSMSFLAHTMSEDDKACLKPRNNQLFVYADMKNCEITALQYLSKDVRLGKIIASGKDVYREIYQGITYDECDTDVKRSLCKNIILPVIYGCGIKRLSEITSLGEDVCGNLIQRLKTLFDTAFDWLQQRQEEAHASPVVDMFGRVRDFTKAPYKARDFHVQGLAATICQERLLDLHKNLKNAQVAFTVYDSYGIVCSLQNLKETILSTKASLETTSTLCPGLVFKSDIQFGPTLLSLKALGK